MSNRLGFMFVAKAPCGHVRCAAWDDAGCEEDTQSFIADWHRHGYSVERIERFAGDAMPEWCPHDCPQTEVSQG